MTTGQPIRVPSDRNKYNNEFMENLRLQIRLNDKNLQANRLFINTGQLPPSTQMADTRSTSEKLADIEGLKRSIVADLSPVAEPSFAYAIIDGVMNSPLNIDNSLFRYLAQNAQQLGLQLSKKYKFGIAGDANDVALIIEFLVDAYNKTRNTFQTIKGYMNSTTNLRSNNTNLQDQIISELKYFLQRSNSLTDKIRDPYLSDQLSHLRSLISEIIYALPTQVQMSKVLNSLTTHSLEEYKSREDLEYDLYEREGEEDEGNIQSLLEQRYLAPGPKYNITLVSHVINMIENLPNLDSVRTLLNIIEKGIKNNSLQTINDSIYSLEGLFSQWLLHDPPTDFNLDLQEFRNTFLKQANEEIAEQNRISRISTINQIEAQNEQQVRDAKAQRVYVINPDTDPAKITFVRGNNSGGGGEEEEEYENIQSLNPTFSQVSNQQNIPQQTTRMFDRRQSQNQTSEQRESGSAIPIPGNISEDLSLNYANIYPSGNSSERSFVMEAPSLSEYEEEIPEGASFMPEPSPQPKFSDVSSGKRAPPPVPVTKSSIEQKEVYSGQNPSLIADLRRHHYDNIGQLDLPKDKKQELVQLFEDNIKRFQNSGQSIDDFNDNFVRVAQDYIERFHHDEELRQRQERDRKRIDEGFERQKSILIPSSKEQQSYNDRKVELKKIYGPKDIYRIQAELAKQNPVLYAIDQEFHKTGKGLKKGRGISSDYRDFGINKINHKKLDDGILTVRRKSNTNIPDMPSKRISRKLQKIIKHISGGGVPDYNDLNNLEDGEKDYLHKLISKSNLTERLSVPAPSKDQEEKDFHQFEVMKGEILSGNDSKELVKKFKVLILKLAKQNVLPKTEVNELLTDLLSLGY